MFCITIIMISACQPPGSLQFIFHTYPCQIMMMGSLEASVEEAQRIPDDLPPVINDLDIEEEEVAIENRSEYLQKVRHLDYNLM